MSDWMRQGNYPCNNTCFEPKRMSCEMANAKNCNHLEITGNVIDYFSEHAHEKPPQLPRKPCFHPSMTNTCLTLQLGKTACFLPILGEWQRESTSFRGDHRGNGRVGPARAWPHSLVNVTRRVDCWIQAFSRFVNGKQFGRAWTLANGESREACCSGAQSHIGCKASRSGHFQRLYPFTPTTYGVKLTQNPKN